jgi:hypothetical protein
VGCAHHHVRAHDSHAACQRMLSGVGDEDRAAFANRVMVTSLSAIM